MSLRFHLASYLDESMKAAAQKAGLSGADFAPEIRVADPKHGDYQANGVLACAKKEKKNPRALANDILANLPEDTLAMCDASIAGPGFINFTLKPDCLHSWMQAYGSKSTLTEGAGTALHGQTWVIDYSSPNTAKQMHVGHLRSIVIGEAISRLASFAGAKVVRDNHIGDWGTQFGKIIWAYKRHLNKDALAKDPLDEFERLYKIGNNASDSDPAALEEARQELVKLQSGDAENLKVWQHINEVSVQAMQTMYDRFGVRFDETLGESFYNDKVDQVYRELTELNLAETSQGALVVFHPEHPRFNKQPFIVRKSDGAANYASTDLATILYRTTHFKADNILYVVDKRQSDHFEQLFLTTAKWFAGYNRAIPRLEHVDFGTVLGDNGRPLKTRDGENIKLKALLDEAVERALKLVQEKSTDLSPEEQQSIAEIIGVGSVQYADLSQNRSSDYVFSWDKMISLEGNTAAYLLYAIARIHSIFRKQNLQPGDSAGEASPLETPEEISLARKLVKFADSLTQASQQLRPHILSTYLYELAGEFSAFYNANKVAVEDSGIRARRLELCGRTLLILETGLQLLGLRTLTRM